jgi:hypothetical protein
VHVIQLFRQGDRFSHCRWGRDDLSEMPFEYGLPAQQNNCRRVNLFDRGLYGSRSPKLDATHRVLLRDLEVAQKEER